MNANKQSTRGLCAGHGWGANPGLAARARGTTGWAALACLCLVLAVSGWGTASAAPRTLSSSQLATLKRIVAHAQAIPRFSPPGPAVKASAARGDRVLAFPSNSEISYCSTELKDLVKIGQRLGIAVTNFSTTGQPSQWVQGALQAVSARDDAFAFTCGIPAKVIRPQLLKARQEKVGTILDQQYNVNDPPPPLVTAATGIPLLKAERLLADYAMIKNHGKPFHVLVLTANNIVSGVAAADAVKKEFRKRLGSDAPVRVINVPVADWATRLQSTVSSALQNDPKITAVIACFDGMVPNTLPAVEAARNPSLKIYTYGAGPGVVKLIKTTHGVVAADVGASANWAAYVLMDEFLRVITHQQVAPPNEDYPPLRMWTPDNVGQYFAVGGGYGSRYVAGFRRLWGLGG